MSAPQAYRGSITREQWLVNETRTVARLMLDEDIADTAGLVDAVVSANPFQYPTERELKSITRACARRLAALSDDPQLRRRLVELIAHGTPDQLAQTNLYAMMRDNRIVWDFMTCVVARKLEALDPLLRRREIADFVKGLRAQDGRAARWSDATANKVRQVLTACLERCGMYDRATERIAPPLLDLDLEAAIRANGDDEVLPTLGVAESPPACASPPRTTCCTATTSRARACPASCRSPSSSGCARPRRTAPSCRAWSSRAS